MATHPPLAERIRCIEPNWDGRYPKLATATTAGERSTPSNTDNQVTSPLNFSGSPAAVTKPLSTKDSAGLTGMQLDNSTINRMGEVDCEGLQIARTFIQPLDSDIYTAAHEPFSARALVYCLLLDDNPSIQQQ
jgi:hypothetical protein